MKTISPAEPQDDDDFEPDDKYRLTDDEIDEIIGSGESASQDGENEENLFIDEEDIED